MTNKDLTVFKQRQLTGTGKGRQFHVRLTPQNDANLKIYTEETGISINASINEALTEFFQHYYER